MTEPVPVRPAHSATRGRGARVALWGAFLLVHLLLARLNLAGTWFPTSDVAAVSPFNDVTGVYRQWAEQALQRDFVAGIDGPFVYPIVALLPILASASFGFGAYGITWIVMVTALNAAALAFLTRRASASLAPAWWWVTFLLLLGPIAIGRIDSVTVPIALVGVLLAGRHPLVATALITVGAWIKIWPAALVAALLITGPLRARVAASAALTSAVILGVALAFGGGAEVFSFISGQTGRGLQVEAPVTSFWLWQTLGGAPGASVYFDRDMITYQVTGDGAGVAAAVMTPVLAVAVAGISALGVLAVRRGAPSAEVLAPLSLALVVGLIAFNKVGSPQFMAWIDVPVLLGLTTGGRSFRVPAALALAVAALTQLIYPTLYHQLVALDPTMIAVLAVRNALIFVLLGWAIVTLQRFPARARLEADLTPMNPLNLKKE